MARAAVADD